MEHSPAVGTWDSPGHAGNKPHAPLSKLKFISICSQKSKTWNSKFERGIGEAWVPDSLASGAPKMNTTVCTLPRLRLWGEPFFGEEAMAGF